MDKEGQKSESTAVGKNSGSSYLRGFAMAAHITGYIIGPLIAFGVVGYFLDRVFSTKPLLMIAAVLIAFVVSNVLVIQKANSLFDVYKEKKPSEPESK